MSGRRSHPGSRVATLGLAVGLVALGASGALSAPTATRSPAAVSCKQGFHRMGGHCMKNPAVLSSRPKPKPKLKRRLTATAIPAPAPLASPPAPPPVVPAAPPVCQDSGLYSVVAPFLTHLSSAHLEESPLQQVHDLLNTDQYVLIHTALLDSMLAGLVPVLHDLLNGDLNGAVTGLLTRTCAAGPAPVSVPTPASIVPGPGIAATAIPDAQAPPPPPTPPAPKTMPMPMTHPMPPAAPSATVDMTGIAFVPAEVTVKVGGAVSWHNSDPVPHTVTSVGPGPLASPTIGANGDYSLTFSKPGTYAYLCRVHPNMRGRVVVE